MPDPVLVVGMTRGPILCGLCGAHGHLASACPWQSVTRALVASTAAREDAERAEARERRRIQPEEND